MTQKADLHIHTTVSGDSLNTPEDVFKKAKEAGLSAVAFTDHETTRNHGIGHELSKKYKIEFLPGIEVSSIWKGQTAHMLGYFSGSVSAGFNKFVDKTARAGARDIAASIIKQLQETGMDITLEEYDEISKKSTTSSSPLLTLMIEKGYVRDIRDYQEKTKHLDVKTNSILFPSVTEIISQIHQAGGIAVLAHPGAHKKEHLHSFTVADIEKIAEAGLDGIEVYHYSNNESKKAIYLDLAQKYNLLVTGGSDNHGIKKKGRPNEIGSYWCDWELVKDKITRGGY